MPIGTMRGDGKAENPCVRRCRHRRLCSWLWLQGLQATAESMLNESDAIFDLRRLRGFVVGGRWSDALRYLARFLPPPDTRRPLSAEAMALRLFLGAHRSLANIVAGEDGSAAMYGQYLSHDRTLCHGAIRLRSIMLNVLCSRQQVRFHRRYPLKKQAHSILPSTILGKQARGARASALAKHYLGKRRSLLAISSPSQESCDELSMSKALNWVADIVDECLKAGKRVESHQVNPLQISVTEGSSVVFSGLILNHEMPSVANEGAPAAPVSQIMNFTSHAENHGTDH